VSIRLRLTVLYTGLMAIAFALFGMSLYVVLRLTFIQAVDDTLQNLGDRVAVEFQQLNQLPRSRLTNSSVSAAMVRTEEEVWDSWNMEGAFPLPEDAQTGTPTYTTEIDANKVTYRLYTVPVLFRGKPAYYVQVAYRLEVLDMASLNLRWPLGLGILLFLGMAAVAVWWVAGRALSPIDSVARAAEAIGESADLSLRVPYRGPEDEVGRLVGTFNDMLDQLQAMYARMSSSIDAQQRFVADASHELRTPLTIIRGNVDYLQKVQAFDQEALGDIGSEAERMSHMVEELLTMARADAGQTVDLQPVVLGPLVTEACRKAQAMPHEVEFRTELPEALDRVTVLGHPEWLSRCILILVDNAFKYTAAGTVTVRVGRHGDGVVIQVKDTGMGIAREDLPHVFERFYRADRARARGGTGLGLAIAKWAAGVHGGDLTVESELGKGSTFSLWLPVVRQA
jgi:two-component system, OmpR family, sensor kinase